MPATTHTRPKILLGVNIDHIATIREARGERYPDPVQAAMLAEEAGADGITIHLREDRRHIQERDVRLIKDVLVTRMNLEMAVTEEMIDFAEEIQPEHCCLVPEKREELTTEGGLDVVCHEKNIKAACDRLSKINCEVSLFIDADIKQIEASLRCGASAIEIHTGKYAEAKTPDLQKKELMLIEEAVHYASSKGLIVNAGHGLNYHNIEPVLSIKGINELNIGHSIIARALFVGLKEAVVDMKNIINGQGR
jgi:pyridoxine 5-phosphate synthase